MSLDDHPEYTNMLHTTDQGQPEMMLVTLPGIDHLAVSMRLKFDEGAIP